MGVWLLGSGVAVVADALRTLRSAEAIEYALKGSSTIGPGERTDTYAVRHLTGEEAVRLSKLRLVWDGSALLPLLVAVLLAWMR